MNKLSRSAPEATAFAEKVLRAEAEAILHVVDHLDDHFHHATELLATCAGNVIVSGMGKSGLIARKISATLASTGTPSHFLHPTEAMHGDLGRIRSGDVVILLSYSGATDDILALAALVRQDGVPVVAFCGRPDSHLARLAEARLCVGDLTEACPHNLAPTTSTTAMLALGDALALAVSKRRSFSADDFHKRHPGGALGRLMMAVTDVLRFRAGVNLPLILETATVQQMLEQADRIPRRAGAVLIVDQHDRLTGIFTDADLRRRLLREGPAVLDRPVGELMTRSPRALPHTALVRDAVQMVRELRLDELPVVDGDHQPVGLIDVQDLLSLKVIEE